jgi:hypothetical protein
MIHVLPSRKGPGGAAVNEGHYVLLDSRDPVRGTFRVLDPPHRAYRATEESVAKVWTGTCLLLGTTAVEHAQRVVRAAWIRRFALAGGVVIVVIGLLALLYRRRSRARAAGVTALLLAVSAELSSCSRDAANPAGASAPSPVEVVGLQSVDFGTVQLSDFNLTHEFRLRNNLETPLEIISLRRTCGCLAARADPTVVPASGETRVFVEMDGRVITGDRDTSVVVEFNDARVQPIVLRIRALFEGKYSVVVTPQVWVIPESNASPAASSERLRRTFSVTEFVSVGGPDPGETVVRSNSPELRVERVGTWSARGWRAPGFAREVELDLSVEFGNGWPVGDRQLELEFLHRKKGAPETGAPEVRTAALLLRRL